MSSELLQPRCYIAAIPPSIIGAISFLIGTLYGKDFSAVNWETILAGFLGLGGGAFALLATRWSEHRKEIKSVFIYCTKVTKRADLALEKLAKLKAIAEKRQHMPTDRFEIIAKLVTDLLPTQLSDNAPIEIIERHAEIEISTEALLLIDTNNDTQNHDRTVQAIESISTSISLLKESCETHLSKIRKRAL